MSRGFDPRIGARPARWPGAVLVFAGVLAPLMAWLSPLGFAPLAALTGLLAVASLRLEPRHLPGAAVLMVAAAWAIGSITWSPYHPDDLESWTALKLVLGAVLYWGAVCAAGRASDRSRRTALLVFAWGMAAYGALLVVEGATGAAAYRALRVAIGDPIRPDLGVKNVAQGGYVLSVFLPAAALAAVRAGAPRWLGVVMVAGVAVSSLAFGSDAPLLALTLAGLVGLAAMRWPRGAPITLAATAGAFFLFTPALVWALQACGVYARMEAAAPLSWSMRMGYWRHAAAWIGDHPLRGWGLDASRMFAPGIRLHPHDAALQIWLELGVVGACAAAAFWGLMLADLRRPRADAAMAVALATATVYLVFAAVSFGVWQDWWIGVGALAAAFCVAVARQPPRSPAAPRAATGRGRPSTATPISE